MSKVFLYKSAIVDKPFLQYAILIGFRFFLLLEPISMGRRFAIVNVWALSHLGNTNIVKVKSFATIYVVLWSN